MKTVGQQLLERGFAVIDYPQNLTNMVSEAIVAWQKFCALPIDRKSCFAYSGDTGSGYEWKDTVGKTFDRKENFHITIAELARLVDIADGYTIEQAFLAHGNMLLAVIYHPIYQIAQQLEVQLDISDLAHEVDASWRSWFLRFLHYFPGQPKKSIIAASHCDKAGLTAYLGETGCGVEYFSVKNRTWQSMPTGSGTMVVTANMQMQYKTHGRVTALYHRVVANHLSESYGRDSIVCFIPFLNTPQYDKSKWGRLQDMPVGFNYRMSHEEFQKYFR